MTAKQVDIAYMRELASNYEGVISLGQGTPCDATPGFIYEAIHNEYKSNASLGKYTPCAGDTELRELISSQVNDYYQIETTFQNVYVTTGAIAAVWGALMSIASEGDEVIIVAPYYPKYINQLELLKLKSVIVNAKEENNWQIDPEDIKKAITDKTKAVILNNPVNPSGALFPEETIRRIVELAVQNDFFVITDEAYDFVLFEDNSQYLSAIEIEEARDRVILCKSFSKEYAMTGWRIGFLVASEKIVRRVNKILPYIVIAASSVSQFAAKTILKNPEKSHEFMMSQVDLFSENFELVTDWLDAHEKYFSYIRPQGTFYILPKLLFADDAASFAINLLKKAQVVAIPGDCMGAPKHIRLSYCMAKGEVEEALSRIDKYLKNI